MSLINTDIINQMTEWRRHLHSVPECGFELKQTSDFIAEKLDQFGLQIERNVGRAGVVGTLRSGDGSASIGLRADMDALYIHEANTFSHRSKNDGKMHACGHDGHSAMLLGAAKVLSKSKKLNGTVHFIFQPDEEHGEGAQAMIDDGLFERFSIDAVYGLHNLPGIPVDTFSVRPGSLMASESSFKVTLSGGGGHAALPHMNADPLLAGAQFVQSLQTVVSRVLSAIHETAVISVTEFTTNGTVNVIPSEVIIKGDCRCFTDAALKKIEQNIERIVSGISLSADLKYSFEFKNTFHSTINSAIETQNAIEAAIEVLGANNVNPRCDPLTISEDFSSMLRVKPGCYALLGNGVGAVGGAALHSPNYDFNDQILEKGAAYWVQLAHAQLA